MNEANQFYENMRSRHDAVLNWRDGSSVGTGDEGKPNNGADDSSQTSASVSGNGDGHGEDQSTGKKDGTLSPAVKGMNLTPNG